MSKEIEMQVVGTDGNYEVILPVPATHASSHSSNGTDPINEIREQHNGLAQKFWRGTQAEYDALTTKDEDTMYIITDASSAASGDMLKEVYDTENKSTDIFKYVDTHTNNNTIHVTADERNAWNAKLDSFTETDPTVPDWAKQATKPSYTASEVGALPSSTVIPTKVSQLTNDSGFITGYTETDPTVPAWAKAASKPSYTANEVGASPSGHTHDDRYYTETEVNNLLAGKQDASTAINTSNIGSQSVNYANSAGSANSATNATNAGNADTVDGCHVNLDPASAGIKLTYAGTGELTSGSSGLTTGHIYLQYE